ncbi:MAG: YggS family pyridoxal phosphate-dependent enzyme [Chloroflexi bacterium]|nr:YggS family pyridoxal phosphate-dependent enzyme [Chloroflexota bacterium]
MDDLLIASICERYQRVLGQIAEAGRRSGYAPARLVVVTKSQPVDVVRAAVAAGVSVLGENYADEAAEKISALRQTAVEWHMIGHVQSRKAHLVAAHFTMLHSLDSVKLAARLDRFCAETGRILPVLLEVNVSGEESKFGFPAWDESGWPDLLPVFGSLLEFSRLRVGGLMTMPPYFENAEQTRPYFRRMRRLQEYLTNHLPQADWSELSMGTSADFLAAVEEGATYVRIGQAILGPRPVSMERA